MTEDLNGKTVGRWIVTAFEKGLTAIILQASSPSDIIISYFSSDFIEFVQRGLDVN